MSNRTIWALLALAAMVLVGVGMLGVRLWPYWVAKHHGRGADLPGAVLVWAPLRGADLDGANFREANLRGADLRGAFLDGADLTGSDLRGADLRDTKLEFDRLLIIWGIRFRHARYDASTRWPAGFDPRAHGAVKVPWTTNTSRAPGAVRPLVAGLVLVGIRVLEGL
jgi:Pentapeptide repeats (8 copies)